MNKSPDIVGAGLTGLIAAHAWPASRVFEIEPKPRQAHNALLRFRTDLVGKLTGIEFQKVTVRKGIWVDGAFVAPSIKIANWYSRKVTGQILGDRSIWSIDPAERFVAPEDFYEQLVRQVGARISWGAHYFGAVREPQVPFISTVPLPLVVRRFSLEGNDDLMFNRSPIVVDRYRVEGAHAHQTVYFPQGEFRLYRASLTGSMLIVESVKTDGNALSYTEEIEAVRNAFGLEEMQLSSLGSSEQQFGKIVPVASDPRKALLYRLTQEQSLYSLGRFATWRNILLDDVIQDISVIRRLMKADQYERKMTSS